MRHVINSGILSQDGPVNLSGYDALVWFGGIHVPIFPQPLDLSFLIPTIGSIHSKCGQYCGQYGYRLW